MLVHECKLSSSLARQVLGTFWPVASLTPHERHLKCQSAPLGASCSRSPLLKALASGCVAHLVSATPRKQIRSCSSMTSEVTDPATISPDSPGIRIAALRRSPMYCQAQ